MPTIRRRKKSPTPPSPPPISWDTLSKPGRPPRDRPRDLHLPGLPEGVTINVSTRVLPSTQRPPRCVWPGCLNQALLTGNQPAEHLFQKRYRAWCYRHRPANIYRDGLTRPSRPKYSAANPLPADRPLCLVPHCGRPAMMRNRRADGTPRWRRFCDAHHRNSATVPEDLRGESPTAASMPEREPTVPRVRVRAAPLPDRPGTVVPFKDEFGKINQSWTLSPEDMNVLQSCHGSGMGAYQASTHPKLSRSCPTALVLRLYAQWGKYRHHDD